MLIELTLAGGGATLWHKLKRKQPTLIEQLAEKQNQPIAISTKKLVSDLKNAIWGNDRQELQLKLDPTMQTEVDLRNQTAQIIFMDGTLAPLHKLLQITDEFEGTMRNNFLLSIGPGLVNISGVYLLHSGIAASMGLFYAGTVVGLGNTLLPLIRHQDTHPKKKSRTQ